MSKKIIKPGRKFWNIGQDWASVAVGFAMIVFVILAGYTINTPTFGGKAGWEDYTGIVNVFKSPSLGVSLLSSFLVFGIFGAIGLVLSGESLRKFFRLSFCLPACISFPIYFFLHRIQES